MRVSREQVLGWNPEAGRPNPSLNPSSWWVRKSRHIPDQNLHLLRDFSLLLSTLQASVSSPEKTGVILRSLQVTVKTKTTCLPFLIFPALRVFFFLKKIVKISQNAHPTRPGFQRQIGPDTPKKQGFGPGTQQILLE